jgi:hypothetical protein
MQIKNVSPYGAADVPLLRREGEPFDQHGAGCVERDEVVDVTEDQARRLLPQVENWQPDDAEAQAIADELAEEADAEARVAAGEVPSESDLKPVWVAYAQSKGDVDAAKKTKKQMVAEYGAQGDGTGDPA